MLNYKELENIYAKRAPIFNCNKTKTKNNSYYANFFYFTQDKYKIKIFYF